MAVQPDRLSLTLGSSLQTIDLFEAASSARKHELQYVVFRLADLVTDLRQKLES